MSLAILVSKMDEFTNSQIAWESFKDVRVSARSHRELLGGTWGDQFDGAASTSISFAAEFADVDAPGASCSTLVY